MSKNQLAKHRHILTQLFRVSLCVRRHLRTAGRLFLIDSFNGIFLPTCPAGAERIECILVNTSFRMYNRMGEMVTFGMAHLSQKHRFMLVPQ